MATSSFQHPARLGLPTPREIESRVEAALRAAVDRACGRGAPPRLVEALRYSVFPAGGRLRPQLCIVASLASGDRDARTADAAAAAVELLHCASLVHDDMPCFDGAGTRRGKPSVHAAYGEATALLVGDALIVHAFAEVARGAACRSMVSMLAEAAGARRGLVAGQAWESEPAVDVDEYHRAKTASLFEVAASLGAIAGGADPAPWRAFGEAIGRAYQAADDVADAAGEPACIGKPTGRDSALARPTVVAASGLDGAKARLGQHVRAARAAVPRGAGEPLVQGWLARVSARLDPEPPHREKDSGHEHGEHSVERRQG